MLKDRYIEGTTHRLWKATVLTAPRYPYLKDSYITAAANSAVAYGFVLKTATDCCSEVT
jgi:hypothetical protein